mgnify:CR=1 FL=1|tara:strand:- start:2993 stop:3169 length:177 start_codon:yes stop_codon:yes gene_type:complete
MLKKFWLAIIESQEKRAKQFMKFRSSYRALKELSELNDKELRDIGINRYDIPRIAFGE